MANRSDGKTFSTTGRPPDGSWMDSGQMRPSWMENEARNTTDSGMGSMESQGDGSVTRRRYADIQKKKNSVQWDGPHKRILFDSEDPESTLSGSETQETRPGWPPDDMCADSTRYKGSFNERERKGLQLLSPVVQSKVIKLQRDLEEAKAESRYLRARPVDSPVVATNRL